MYPRSNPPPSRRPYEDDGRFYAGHVKITRGGRVIRRRCLCFVLATGSVVGASQNFCRSEAYDIAHRAASGTLPPVPATLRGGAKVAAILQVRGFPIASFKDDSIEIDESTADAMRKEFAK